jgi:hypothetical protein
MTAVPEPVAKDVVLPTMWKEDTLAITVPLTSMPYFEIKVDTSMVHWRPTFAGKTVGVK